MLESLQDLASTNAGAIAASNALNASRTSRLTNSKLELFARNKLAGNLDFRFRKSNSHGSSHGGKCEADSRELHCGEGEI
jgi:hypothetical protein